MESKDNTASPYLPVLEIQPAQTGQVGLSCLLQQPGNSLSLASPAVEDWLVPGHGRDLGHGGCRVGPLQGQGPAPVGSRTQHGWAGPGLGPVCFCWERSTGHSILWESVHTDTDAAPHGARRQDLWSWCDTPPDESPSVGAGCMPAPLPALLSLW